MPQTFSCWCCGQPSQLTPCTYPTFVQGGTTKNGALCLETEISVPTTLLLASYHGCLRHGLRSFTSSLARPARLPKGKADQLRKAV